MDPLQAQASYSKVCQLLINKGGEALRRVLQTKIRTSPPPSTLDSLLNTHKKSLQKIRYSVINAAQWKLLFPASGSADSNNFDITLLTILLRNVCGLPSPAAGWNVMPLASDTSISADILRIKMFRNEVYGHISSAQLDDTKFETLWQEISQPLIKLGIPQQDIDDLKEAPLSPEEESYIAKLKEWKELEDDLISKQNDIQREVFNLNRKCLDIGDSVENIEETIAHISDSVARVENTVVKLQTQNAKSPGVDKLAKFVFKGKVEELSKKFQSGTRRWFFDDFKKWFDDEKSSVIILTAGPGVGKSVLSAKICELYEDSGQLAACHFCDFKTSDYRDPHRILQSLASQMSDNVDGFRDKLSEVLSREHSQVVLSDAFRVLLHDPLSAIDRTEPMLIVVDALDESRFDQKSEFLELISNEFPQLPKWIKIFITSRPELQVRKKLKHFNLVEIHPNNKKHKHDLEQFVMCCLPHFGKHVVPSIVENCDGSFLYAYYLVNEVKHLGIKQNVFRYAPQGISGFYKKQFERLKKELQRFERNTEVSIFKTFLNLVAASVGHLPLRLCFTCMGLSNEQFEIREAIIGIMSEILPVYDDCLTVFHKSLWDWLRLDGYEEHAYAADVVDGGKRLWDACKKVYMDIDSLSSVSEFKISPMKKYALEKGWQYLLKFGDIQDFHFFLNVKVNYLKLKYFNLAMDKSSLLLCHILLKYKSRLPDHLFVRLFQLYTFMHLYEMLDIIDMFDLDRTSLCERYLQCFANEMFGLVHNSTVSMKDASEILDKTIWLEKVTKETNSCQIISNALLKVEAISSSPDNKLLACRDREKVVVYELPSLKLFFQLHVTAENIYRPFIVFSPDSSFFLLNSLQSCISIRNQSEVPFIQHRPDQIYSCSFFSFGTRLVSFGEKSIEVWDVKTKELLVKSQHGLTRYSLSLSIYDSYILVFEVFGRLNVFDSTTLQRVEIARSAKYKNCIQLISPDVVYDDESFGIEDCWQLPTGEAICRASKYCSKAFTWNGRKCVVSTDNGTSFVVYDCLSGEIVDIFQMSCLPSYRHVNYISNLGGNNFLISFNSHLVFVVSLERSSQSLAFPFISNKAYPIICALSPDDLFVACSYGYPVLKIMNVDNGRTLQIVEPKQTPIACWWSKLYLWVVCEGLVVVKYPYNATETQIVGNCVGEWCFDCQGKVLKFAESVLVTQMDDKICISKIVHENLSPRQILDSKVNDSWIYQLKVAISTDGCAVLIHGSTYLELWEIGCDKNWDLFWTGTLDDPIDYGYLTGDKNSRRVLLLSNSEIHGLSCFRYSFDHPSGTQKFLLPLGFSPVWRVSICLDSKLGLLMGRPFDQIHFVDVSDGKLITSICVGYVDHFFFVPSKRLLLLFRGSGVIQPFEIHNVDHYLPLPLNLS